MVHRPVHWRYPDFSRDRNPAVSELGCKGPTVRDAHRLGIYDTTEFLTNAVVDFLRTSAADEAVVAILPAARHADVEQGLLDVGFDVQAAKDDGRYLAVDSDELAAKLTTGDGVDHAGFDAATERLLTVAKGRSTRLAVCADIHSALWEAGRIETVLELERLWNALPDDVPFRLLCMYSSGSFHRPNGDDPFIELCRQHASVEPVEEYASIVPRTGRDRTVALLEHQQHSGERDRELLAARRREIEEELDACVRQALEQRVQFKEAIHTRDVIGQAKGIIMVRWHIDSHQAFERLREASNRSNRKLRFVAQAVVNQQLRRG